MTVMTRFQRSILKVVIAAILFPLPDGASRAEEYCRLERPTINAHQLEVKVTCEAKANAETVRYPVGPLYVGVSLFTLDPGLARAVAPYIDNGEGLDLEAQEIRRPTQSAELSFQIPPNISQTHILVAVWDRKNKCANCGSRTHTFGRVDGSGLPIPVDVWPPPICDVAKLRARGYFAWSAGASLGDPEDMTSEMGMLADANDCWMHNAKWPGRGVSYLRWRVAPFPR
jgi:hypothetical protein